MTERECNDSVMIASTEEGEKIIYISPLALARQRESVNMMSVV